MTDGRTISRRVLMQRAGVIALATGAHPLLTASVGVSAPRTASGRMDGLPARAGARISEPTTTPMPFSMVGFELPPDGDVEFRTSIDGSSWDSWTKAARLAESSEGPDPGSPEDNGTWKRMTHPVWVGEAGWLQVRGVDPRRTKAHLIDSVGLGRSRAARAGSQLLSALFAPGIAEAVTRPGIVTRAQWEADESWRDGDPSYASSLRFAVIHHTVNSNNHTQDDVPAIIRGIYRYHTQTLGWRDIGYNFLVDRWGRVYEGRYGGVDKAVIGAHAGGYNTGSVGVAAIGCFDTNHCSDGSVPSGMLSSIDRVVAWKFLIHGVNSLGTTVENSTTLPTIVGHRDTRSTACPGNRLYQRVRGSDSMSVRVATRLASGVIPVAGDWNGDGITNIGWFQPGGRWRLRMTDGSIVTFVYGQHSRDVPVVGDWNGDGIDGVGIYRPSRGGEWHLRNSLSSAGGQTVHQFVYGRHPGDVPVVGDWNGDGIDGVGIYRPSAGGGWHLRNSLSGLGQTEHQFVYGMRRGDVPVTGDWNGDGIDGVGIYRPSAGGEWHLRNSLSGAGQTTHRFTYGVQSGDIPVAGDWMGEGRYTAGIHRAWEWHMRRNLDPEGTTRARLRFA